MAASDLRGGKPINPNGKHVGSKFIYRKLESIILSLFEGKTQVVKNVETSEHVLNNEHTALL